jgi:hypothetical protein
MLTLPPFNLIPSAASASTTGISAPRDLPTSAASGRSCRKDWLPGIERHFIAVEFGSEFPIVPEYLSTWFFA